MIDIEERAIETAREFNCADGDVSRLIAFGRECWNAALDEAINHTSFRSGWVVINIDKLLALKVKR